MLLRVPNKCTPTWLKPSKYGSYQLDWGTEPHGEPYRAEKPASYTIPATWQTE